jgi:hypothetical protein
MGSEKTRAVDFGYLELVCAGDRAVILEVLETFCAQAASWRDRLENPGPEQRQFAHLIKGSALGIGAGRLGEAAGRAEFGGPEDLRAVREALVEALEEINRYLTRCRAG